MKKIILTSLFFLIFITSVFGSNPLQNCKTFDNFEWDASINSLGDHKIISMGSDTITLGMSIYGAEVVSINNKKITESSKIARLYGSNITLNNGDCLKVVLKEGDIDYDLIAIETESYQDPYNGVKKVISGKFNIYNLFSEDYPNLSDSFSVDFTNTDLDSLYPDNYIAYRSDSGFFVFFKVNQSNDKEALVFSKAFVVFPLENDFKKYKKSLFSLNKPYLKYIGQDESDGTKQYNILLKKNTPDSSDYFATNKIESDSDPLKILGHEIELSKRSTGFSKQIEIVSDSLFGANVFSVNLAYDNTNKKYAGNVNLHPLKNTFDFEPSNGNEKNVSIGDWLSFTIKCNKLYHQTTSCNEIIIKNLKINFDKLKVAYYAAVAAVKKAASAPSLSVSPASAPSALAVATAQSSTKEINISKHFTIWGIDNYVASDKQTIRSDDILPNIFDVSVEDTKKYRLNIPSSRLNIPSSTPTPNFNISLISNNSSPGLTKDEKVILDRLQEKIELIKSELRCNNAKIISYNNGEVLIIHSRGANNSINFYVVVKTDNKKLNERINSSEEIELRKLMNDKEGVEYFYPDWTTNFGWNKAFPEFDKFSKEYPNISVTGATGSFGFDSSKVDVFVSEKSINNLKSGDIFKIKFKKNNKDVIAGIARVTIDDSQHGNIVFKLPNKSAVKVNFRTVGWISALEGTGTAYVSSPQLIFELEEQKYQLFLIVDMDGWYNFDLDVERVYLIKHTSDGTLPAKPALNYTQPEMAFVKSNNTELQLNNLDLLKELRKNYVKDKFTNNDLIYLLQNQYVTFYEGTGHTIKLINESLGKMYVSGFFHGDFDEMELTTEMNYESSQDRTQSQIMRSNIYDLDYQIFEFNDQGYKLLLVVSAKMQVLQANWTGVQNLFGSNTLTVYNAAIVFPTTADKQHFFKKSNVAESLDVGSLGDADISRHSKNFCTACEGFFPAKPSTGFLVETKYNASGWKKLEGKVKFFRTQFGSNETAKYPEILLMAVANIESNGNLFGYHASGGGDIVINPTNQPKYLDSYVGLMQFDKINFSKITDWGDLKDSSSTNYDSKLAEFAKFQIEFGRKHLESKLKAITSLIASDGSLTGTLPKGVEYYFVLIGYNGGEQVAINLLKKIVQDEQKVSTLSDVTISHITRERIKSVLEAKKSDDSYVIGYITARTVDSKTKEIYEYPFKVMRSAASACEVYKTGFNPSKIVASESPTIKDADAIPEKDSEDPSPPLPPASNVFEALRRLNQKLLDDLFVIVEVEVDQ